MGRKRKEEKKSPLLITDFCLAENDKIKIFHRSNSINFTLTVSKTFAKKKKKYHIGVLRECLLKINNTPQ